MAPKKDKGKKEDEKTGTFNEVEKIFLELQIAECNRKIARLRSAVEDFETRNDELQKAYDKLDEDRADIIAYLKKTLTEKNEENSELKEKVKGLEEIRQIENAEFHKIVTELENNFTMMKDQLTSENKLLAGKLNTLEEFRAIRDDLMKKYEKQEQDFKEQEMSYKRIIYNTEKKYVVAKDKLKKEMEARLLQLAQDFQDATELRIAASTQRVIRENIAVTNEINDILINQNKLTEQNELFKERLRAANMSKELAEEERDKAINKNVVQLKLINKLTTAFEGVKKEKGMFEKRSFDFELLEYKLQKMSKENDNLLLQVRILEQNLHSKLNDQNKSVVELTKVSKERDKLKSVLKDAAIAIQAALKLDQWAIEDPAREAMDRQLLLSQLLEIVCQYRETQQTVSVTTIHSFSKVYQEGDLGFIPKSFMKKRISGQSTGTVSQQLTKHDEIVRDASKNTFVSSSASTSLGETSIKTIPSIHILPPSQLTIEPNISLSLESLESPTKSCSEQEKESDKEKTSIDKKLLTSRLEIQKSIIKDMASSEISYIKSQMASLSKASISSYPQKSASVLKSMQSLRSQQFFTVSGETIVKEEEKQVEDLTTDGKQFEMSESSENSELVTEGTEVNVLDKAKDDSVEKESTDKETAPKYE